MPRYYFDLTHGNKQFTDDEGEELQSERQTRQYARAVLTDVFRPHSDHDTEIAVTVRDANGSRFQAKLSLRLEEQRSSYRLGPNLP